MKEISEREVSEREVSEREVSESEVSESEVSGRDFYFHLFLEKFLYWNMRIFLIGKDQQKFSKVRIFLVFKLSFYLCKLQCELINL